MNQTANISKPTSSKTAKNSKGVLDGFQLFYEELPAQAAPEEASIASVSATPQRLARSSRR